MTPFTYEVREQAKQIYYRNQKSGCPKQEIIKKGALGNILRWLKMFCDLGNGSMGIYPELSVQLRCILPHVNYSSIKKKTYRNILRPNTNGFFGG